MKKLSILFFLTASIFFSKAQNASNPILSLDEAVGTAVKNNFNILMSRNDSASFALDRSYAYAAFLPRVNGTFSKVWNINAQKQELANGQKRDTSGLRSNNLAAAVNLNWTVFDGMKMFATRDRIMELEKLGALGVKAQVLATVTAVSNNYFSIVRQKQQLKAIEEQMSINEERVKLADKKLSVGLGAKPELLQAKVDLNAQKAARLQQITLIEQLKEQMNQLMAVPLTTQYEVSDSIPINYDLNFGSLQNGINSTNIGLLQAQKGIDIAKLSLKEREGELFPTISLNTGYTLGRLKNKAVINSFTPLFNQNLGFNYGVSMSIPIFNNFNTKRLIKQAKLDIQYQELNLKNLASQVDVQLSNAFKDYQLQLKSLALEEENIRLAKENMEISLERFRQGVSTFLELREVQKSLEDAYNRLIAARYNTKLAEIQLLSLKGDLLK
ncbi:MAG: TolC family protein [Chitinophagaceae bacterium]|uniref:TolC family protein n=1 Tax=unclassified Paraflavitalea TaxID=2798305 RepID=UPI003D325ED7|nr:TolC family protein [Chitinophagaceae bacterium]